jgi:SAM-dependent methyltransferase
MQVISLSDAMNVKLICPRCRTALVRAGEDWKCSGCGTPYTRNDGILSFLTPDERFNEGVYEAKQVAAWTASAELRNRIRRSTLLSFINAIRIRFSLSGRRDRIFLKEMKPRAGVDRLILDLGCGGGRHYFCDYGRVVGIDPVLPLLKLAETIYDEVYQTSGFKLPFADGTFDYVVSSDVLGHISDENKDLLFSEINRVLKPGGRTVHCSEADATNVWYRFAHRDPQLFRKYFVDIPGHISLETITQIDRRFVKHGFRAVKVKKLCSTVQEPGTLTAWFDNEYRTKSRLLSLLVSIDKLLNKNFGLREIINFLLEPLAQLDDALTPIDHSPGALIVYEKVAAPKIAANSETKPASV